MKESRLVMGMPAAIEIVGGHSSYEAIEAVFAYFSHVDELFSTYKADSEVSRLNRGEIAIHALSREVQEILERAEETKRATQGYFDIQTPEGVLDPSGIVKGWAINNAAHILDARGCENFLIEVGGDIQSRGHNKDAEPWAIGIRNPFDRSHIVQVVYVSGHGVATSGTAERGAHIYDPHDTERSPSELVSITVIGPNVYEADRFATAAFAMGTRGVHFIESLPEMEAYAIDAAALVSTTSGFEKFLRRE